MRRRLFILVWLLACVLSVMAVTSRRVFQAYTASNGLADNSAQTIRCATSGRLVITTMGQINFFDGNRFSFIDPSKENMYPLPSYIGNYHVYVDKYHHMWLKNTHTVSCVDLLTEMFVNSVEDEFHKFGISEDVKDLFVDGEGVAYLLTDKGLFSVDSRKYYKVREKCNLQDLDTYKESRIDSGCDVERHAGRHNPSRQRRTDVGTHDDRDSLCQRQQASIHKRYGHHRRCR